MTNRSKSRVRIALQKSGRLSDESFELLRRCGIKTRLDRGQLFCHSENFPLDILLVRDDDIPNLVMGGVCDLGIVGTNVLQEVTLMLAKQGDAREIKMLRKLEYGACRLAIAVPDEFNFVDLHSLRDMRIATSYPFLLKKFLQENSIKAEVINLTGSVEIAPRLGIADVICDLVSTGATLEANGLKQVTTIFHSHAALVQTCTTLSNEQHDIIKLFEQRIQGVQQANESKYIMLHAPKSALADIVALLPGVETPTIMMLEGTADKIGIHAVCREGAFWETLEKLKAAGASSILVVPVEKMLA